MDKKNNELARRNTELLEEINRLTDIHSDILKESIKRRYYRNRAYNKLVDQVEKQTILVKEVLEGEKHLKESILRIMDVPIHENKETDQAISNTTEADLSVFKQTMKILDTIYAHEQEDSTLHEVREKILKEIDIKKATVEIKNEPEVEVPKRKALKEKTTNKPSKRKRKSVSRR
ncbi:hypothetical protein NGRA_2410 [Nosema granulosis]|uniref:Uncharacterized protein n=1 Tax=Nosema granulosis TaxID=83296 RepID=A0A9P6KY64_9MICR|nr:hypothetical protein NGRA_2410 [Nosema granulosis]